MAKKEYGDFNIDIRALKLNLSRGNITKSDYDKYVKSLPDLSGQFDEIDVFEEPEAVHEKSKEEAGSDEEDPDDLTFSVVD